VSGCPDWTALTAHRRERRGEEPAAWREALEHLEACPRCRPKALAADPTLMFRRLAKVEPLPAPEAAAEVEAVRQAVAAMRTAKGAARRSRWRGGWGRAAAAAVLAIASLSLGGDDALLLRQAEAAAARTLASAAAQQPLLEELNGPEARILQVNDEDGALVMIYSEKLDV
jgi:hypothetical protein